MHAQASFSVTFFFFSDLPSHLYIECMKAFPDLASVKSRHWTISCSMWWMVLITQQSVACFRASPFKRPFIYQTTLSVQSQMAKLLLHLVYPQVNLGFTLVGVGPCKTTHTPSFLYVFYLFYFFSHFAMLQPQNVMYFNGIW